MAENTGNIPDPIASFRFHIEIEGVIEGMFVDCTGLGVKRKIFKYKEGGVNEYIHQLPDRVSYTNVKMKRGVGSPKLFEWFMEGLQDGKVRYANVSVLLYGSDGEVAKQWDLERSYPVKWTAPSLKVDAKRAAIESLELAHHGLTQAK